MGFTVHLVDNYGFFFCPDAGVETQKAISNLYNVPSKGEQ